MSTSLLDRIKAKRQSIAAKTNRERPAKLAGGKNVIRILPNWASEPEGAFYHDFGQHYIKDASGAVKAVYICTANTFGKACDVCQSMADHAATVDPNNTSAMQILSEAKASSRVLVNALYYNGSHPDPKNSPVILELPPTVFDMVLAIAEDYMANHEIDLFGLSGGYDLTVEKEGSGRDTKYKVVPSPKPRVVDASVLAKAKNLDDYVKQEYDQGLQNVLAALRGAVRGGGPSLPAPTNSGHGGGQRAQPQQSAQPSTPSQNRFAQQGPIDMSGDVIEGVATEVQRGPAPTSAPTEPAMDDIDALLAELDNAA